MRGRKKVKWFNQIRPYDPKLIFFLLFIMNRIYLLVWDIFHKFSLWSTFIDDPRMRFISQMRYNYDVSSACFFIQFRFQMHFLIYHKLEFIVRHIFISVGVVVGQFWVMWFDVRGNLLWWFVEEKWTFLKIYENFFKFDLCNFLKPHNSKII